MLISALAVFAVCSNGDASAKGAIPIDVELDCGVLHSKDPRCAALLQMASLAQAVAVTSANLSDLSWLEGIELKSSERA